MASAAEQLAANLNFGAIAKAEELKKRIWFTLGALIVYRIGSFIPVPGIDAAEVFEDENHRPLVYRRERVLVDDGGSWREIDRAVRSLPFSVSDASGSIAVDAEALDEEAPR